MSVCINNYNKNDVPEILWNNWRWQLKNRITDAGSLEKIIRLSADEKEEITKCLGNFKMAVTPYYASLINKDNPECPIRKQSIPSINELKIMPDESEDPLAEEEYSPVKNIVHRYPDRVLFLLTYQCSMYCRHCTRRRHVGQEDYAACNDVIDKAVDYIQKNSQIRDVLLSGGDPLILSDARLEYIIKKIRSIPHVDIIRIGTRMPVVLPMRITNSLVKMLKKYHPVWINTHFNHSNEITPDSAAACRKIADAGIPLGNQSVLLKGINDDTKTMKELFLNLVKIRVRPYYLFQCDLAQGIYHFRTPVEKGIEIIRGLRGFISGYAVPCFVIDAPKGGGKIPINPDYVIKNGQSGIMLKNYRGDVYSYPNA